MYGVLTLEDGDGREPFVQKRAGFNALGMVF